jgi:hypothetical protein
MSYYYYFFLIVGLSLIIILIHAFISRRKDIPFELFVEALKNENNGHFEAAVITYETALDEVKKTRFRTNNLKNKIIGRLKVLHTNIDYNNNLRFIR